MAMVKMTATEIRSLAGRVLDAAEAIDGISCPAMVSTDMPGSATAAATASALVEDRLADVVARMRTWAATVGASVTAVEQADLERAARLGASR